jgi:hypothetical protein
MVAVIWPNGVTIRIGRVRVSWRIGAIARSRIFAVNSTIATAVTALHRAPGAKKQESQTDESAKQLHNPKPPAKKLARDGRLGLWGQTRLKFERANRKTGRLNRGGCLSRRSWRKN